MTRLALSALVIAVLLPGCEQPVAPVDGRYEASTFDLEDSTCGYTVDLSDTDADVRFNGVLLTIDFGVLVDLRCEWEDPYFFFCDEEPVTVEGVLDDWAITTTFDGSGFFLDEETFVLDLDWEDVCEGPDCDVPAENSDSEFPCTVETQTTLLLVP